MQYAKFNPDKCTKDMALSYYNWFRLSGVDREGLWEIVGLPRENGTVWAYSPSKFQKSKYIITLDHFDVINQVYKEEDFL